MSFKKKKSMLSHIPGTYAYATHKLKKETLWLCVVLKTFDFKTSL